MHEIQQIESAASQLQDRVLKDDTLKKTHKKFDKAVSKLDQYVKEHHNEFKHDLLRQQRMELLHDKQEFKNKQKLILELNKKAVKVETKHGKKKDHNHHRKHHHSTRMHNHGNHNSTE